MYINTGLNGWDALCVSLVCLMVRTGLRRLMCCCFGCCWLLVLLSAVATLDDDRLTPPTMLLLLLLLVVPLRKISMNTTRTYVHIMEFTYFIILLYEWVH